MGKGLTPLLNKLRITLHRPTTVDHPLSGKITLPRVLLSFSPLLLMRRLNLFRSVSKMLDAHLFVR